MAIPVWLDHLILTWGYWAVLVAVALESMGVPFPGETGLLAAAIYAGTGRPLNITLVIVAASAGAILGDNAGYAIGYFGGHPLVRRLLAALRIRDAALAYTQRYFAQHGDKTVFIGRFFALLRATVAFLAGVNRMHWRTFLLWNALGGIAWATLYGLLGFFLGRQQALLGEVTRIIGVGGTVILVVALVALVAFFVIRRRWQEAQPASASGPPSDPSTAPAEPTPPDRPANPSTPATPTRWLRGPLARRQAARRTGATD